MFTSVIKRVLPFALTLLIGAALGSFVKLFTSRGNDTAPAFVTTRNERRGCRSSYRRTSRYDTPRPVILFKPEPGYTDSARRNGVNGVVRLSVVFGADSKVSDVEVLQTLSYGLTEQAIRAAEGIHFNPAVINGEPVSVRKEIEYYFKIY